MSSSNRFMVGNAGVRTRRLICWSVDHATRQREESKAAARLIWTDEWAVIALKDLLSILI
jgi:hypothetical protein